jgi:hypothetical protein
VRFPDDFEFIALKNSPVGDARKEPAHDGWSIDPPLTRGQVTEIFRQGRNYGVRLQSRDVVIDIDPRNGGDESCLGIDVSKYPVVLTPSGGKHIYMTKPPDFKIHHTLKNVFPGIEFKTKGRQVVGPGSTHPNGKKYLFDEIFGSPFKTDADRVMPEHLLQRIKLEESIPTGNGIWTEENLESALSHIDPNGLDHDEWFAIMAASHEATGGAGEDVFIAWEQRDEKYVKTEKIDRQRWQSLKSGKAGNAGAGTLRHLLVERGVKDIGIDTSADEFGPFVDKNPPPPGAPITAAKVNPFDELNKRFLSVQEDGKLRVLELRNDDAMQTLRWVRHSKKDFLEVAQSVYHLPALVKKKKTKSGDTENVSVPVAKIWIENPIPGKRTFPGGTVFSPEIDSERVGESLNLWRGFQYKPNFVGDWSLLSNLLLEVLCRGNRASYEYVLDWMARAVQFPHMPGGVAVVFKGIKGTGKGTMGRTFIKLFGTHGLHVVSSEHIIGRFNIQLMDCIAMFADEAYWAGDRGAEGAFKGLITEPTKLYEAKGLTPRMARNLIHMMIASNSDWVIPAGLDMERRFAVFETSDEIRPKEFFKALHIQLEDGGYEALMWDLVHRDIKNFWPQEFPNTDALTQQKIEGMDHVEHWLFELLDTGNWGGLPVIESKDPIGLPEQFILATDFHSSFIQYLAHRRSGRAIQTQVGITLKKFVPCLHKQRIDRPESRIDVPTMRPWAYRLCDMESARAGFVKALGQDVFN